MELGMQKSGHILVSEINYIDNRKHGNELVYYNDQLKIFSELNWVNGNKEGK